MIDPSDPTPDFHALALEVEDALFDADLKPTELRMARQIVKMSLRWSRTTTPQMLQKDFGLMIGMRETHVAETLGWLLGKKIILLERPNTYRVNTDPRTWIVDQLVSAQAKERERELMGQEYIELWPLGAIRAGDPAVAFRDAEVEVQAERAEDVQATRLPLQELENFRISEVTKSGSRGGFSEVTSEIRKSPIAIGTAKSCPIIGTGNRPAVAGGLEEQIGRLERTLGDRVQAYLPWWRKFAGQSAQHVTALRETLDDYATNRGSVSQPDRWMVKTFKNKCRALAGMLHLI
jgi:hypothetical protein